MWDCSKILRMKKYLGSLKRIAKYLWWSSRIAFQDNRQHKLEIISLWNKWKKTTEFKCLFSAKKILSHNLTMVTRIIRVRDKLKKQIFYLKNTHHSCWLDLIEIECIRWDDWGYDEIKQTIDSRRQIVEKKEI